MDSSTQETKVLILDGDSGQVIARGRSAHPVHGSGGARLSDPRDWWRSLREALAQTGRAGEVSAIAVAAQQHGLVVLGEDGGPLVPATLWNDTTSAEDAELLLSDLGGPEAWVSAVGSVPVAAMTVSKWARLRRVQPSVADAARAVRLPHEYLTERLCGRAVGDRGDASGTGWFSPRRGRYAEEVLLLERVRLDSSLLSEVRTGDEPAGEVTERAAGELGLAVGALVGAGTGDNMAAAAGLGLLPGEPVVSLGTSGTVYARTLRPVEDPSGVLAGFADATQLFLPLACTLNATLAIDRFAGWLGLDREDVSPAGEIVVLPYLDGERTPNLPGATGTIAGLTHASTPSQILQAAYDGAVEPLMLGLELLQAADAGIGTDATLTLLGGGSRGPAWRETVGRLSGRPLLVPAEQELTALGAAVLAAAAATGRDAVSLARRWDTSAGTAVPAAPLESGRLEEIRAARDDLIAWSGP
ncbi:MAG: FGGY family carbohydrate kinase [Solirubrobacteraceae bacterium]